WVEGTISGVNLNNVTIAGTGTFALQEQTGGAAKFTNVTATGVGASSPVYSCQGGNFVVTDGGGNSGISGTPYCGSWPAPVYPPYPSTGTGTGTGTTTNIAAGRPASASSSNSTYVASNLTDSDASTYWESTNGAFPQWAQTDLGQNYSIGKVVLKLPTSWGARTQTLSLLGSTDGSTFSTIKASAGYTFDPSTNNTVTITLNATTARYVRANITANTGWSAGQLSDYEVFPSS
ncbi:MAG: hypothetical protein QOF84_3786, partial [Streptomyces sp.]|nr:hypothetical protein [Streptomyces sp.]